MNSAAGRSAWLPVTKAAAITSNGSTQLPKAVDAAIGATFAQDRQQEATVSVAAGRGEERRKCQIFFCIVQHER